jgi:hypothetical protein
MNDLSNPKAEWNPPRRGPHTISERGTAVLAKVTRSVGEITQARGAQRTRHDI